MTINPFHPQTARAAARKLRMNHRSPINPPKLLACLILVILPGLAFQIPAAPGTGETLFLPLVAKGQAGPQIAGCPVFPPENIWNARVDALPSHPRSNDYIETIGRGSRVHADFGSGEFAGGPIGIPYVVVGSSQAKADVQFTYASESDPGPYPIPRDAPIEGGAQSNGDRHVLVLDRDQCLLYELFAAYPQENGSWLAGSGAVFDLRSNALRPSGWTSADAAGLPILPGLVRYDEAHAGAITHAIRFTAPRTQRAFVWPARHFASSRTDPVYPPMGQRFRLRTDYPMNGFSPHARAIVQAMKTYGLILADNGSPWYISGVPDNRWNNTVLHELDVITGADMQAVDSSSLMLHPDSGQVR